MPEKIRLECATCESHSEAWYTEDLDLPVVCSYCGYEPASFFIGDEHHCFKHRQALEQYEAHHCIVGVFSQWPVHQYRHHFPHAQFRKAWDDCADTVLGSFCPACELAYQAFLVTLQEYEGLSDAERASTAFPLQARRVASTIEASPIWNELPDDIDLHSVSLDLFKPGLSKRTQLLLDQLELKTVADLIINSTKSLALCGASATSLYEIEATILIPKGLSLRDSDFD